MVKNQKGGNKTKKQARKFTQSNSHFAKTRFSQDPAEIYSCCVKLLGNGMCQVNCIDGQDRLCIIRKKFRGRGKRDNTIASGTWLLVGIRDFEKPAPGKLEKCDLLEVYNNHDKIQIKQKETRYQDAWNSFESKDNETSLSQNVNINFVERDDVDVEDDDNDFEFESEQTKNDQETLSNYNMTSEEVAVDDI